MKLLKLILIFLLAANLLFAQKETVTVKNNLQHDEKFDHKLNQMLIEMVKGFKGDVGIYVKNLKTGKVASLNADSIFPTASMIKVPITCGIFDKIEKGELAYQTELIYKDSLLYAGEDILGSFKSNEKIWLSKVLMLMITTRLQNLWK